MTFQEFQVREKEAQAKRQERDARIAALPLDQQEKANHDALMQDHFDNLPHYCLDWLHH